MHTDYSIWAFCYAHSTMPHDFFGGVLLNSNRGTLQIPMVYSAIQGGTLGETPRPIVIDTGMTGAWSPSGNTYPDHETPSEVLAKVGLQPSAIETVILTHLHFDHIGNLEAFPAASFYVQRREYENWCRVVAQSSRTMDSVWGEWPLSSIYPPDFERLAELEAAGRLELLDGDSEIAPGVICRLAAESHTFGSQWVEVRTQDGPYVIAGDCVYWYQNLEQRWPPGYLQGNPWNLLELYGEIDALLSGRCERLVPGHDPELFRRHPSWTTGRNETAELHAAAAVGSKLP